MSAVLDVIAVIIIALSVYFAARNGFVKSVMSIGIVVVSILITLMFATKLQAKLYELPVAEKARDAVAERLSEIVTPASSLEGETESDSELKAFISAVGVDADKFTAKLDEWRSGSHEKAGRLWDEMVLYVSTPIVKSVCMLFAVLILFLGSMLVLRLCAFIIDKICVLPVLKQANTVLGVVLGCALAFVRTCMFCSLVGLVLPYFQACDITLLNRIDPAKTLIFAWFDKIDLLALIFG